MAIHKWKDIKARKFSPDERAESQRWVDEQVLEMNLRALRESRDLTQVELARLVEMSQGEVSEAERRTDHRLSTLRRIVRALGGELEVRATFGDKVVRLTGV